MKAASDYMSYWGGGELLFSSNIFRKVKEKIVIILGFVLEGGWGVHLSVQEELMHGKCFQNCLRSS